MEYGFRVHLFYGRSDFPDELSTLDAAASFDGVERPVVALGDINGDGLSDFALGHSDGYELILGAQARWSGSHAGVRERGRMAAARRRVGAPRAS